MGGKHTILGVWGGYSSSFGMKVISFGLSITSRFQTYSFVKFWKQKLFSWFSALTFKFSETKKAYPGSSQIIADHRLLHKPPPAVFQKVIIADHRRSSAQVLGQNMKYKNDQILSQNSKKWTFQGFPAILSPSMTRKF